MKTTKKLMMFMLTVTVVVLCFAFSAGAFAESGKCGTNVKWTFDNTTKVLTFSGAGAMKNYSYTSSPFRSSGVKSVIIEEGITTVGKGILAQCRSLESVVIADSVKTICVDAFYYCDKLTSVKIGKGVTLIDDYAFQACYALATIEIPDSVKKIDYRAFDACKKLKSITIPDSVTNMGTYVFNKCVALENVKFGSGLKEIPSYTFYGCTKLAEITIPENITVIGNNAFNGCSNLGKINIHNNVDTIGSDAFSGTAYYKNSDNWVNGVLYIGKHLMSAKSSVSGDYVIPEGTVSISGEAFYDCDKITGVKIPGSVKKIGSYAFACCSDLKSVTISDAAASIDYNAFYKCYKLENLKLGNKITSIDSYAFYNCTSLKDVKIPGSVKKIGSSAFAHCNALQTVTISDAATSIEYSAFYNCQKLETANLGNKITSIGNYAFYNCVALKSIAVPDTVKTLGCDSFRNCSALETAVVGMGITELLSNTFRSCTSLRNVTLNKKLVTVKAKAFYNCSKLTDVYYSGYKTQWKAIEVESGNYRLRTAAISCRYDPAHTHTLKTTTRYPSAERTGKIETVCTTCKNLINVRYVYNIDRIVFSADKFYYDGAVHKPKVYVKNVKNRNLTEGLDYDVVYENSESKEMGVYDIKVVFKGAYKGEEIKKYSINPRALTSSEIKVAEDGFGGVNIKWDDIGDNVVYRIYLYNSTTRKYEYVDSAKKVRSYTFDGVEKGKTYYVAIRACHMSDEGLLYGAYKYTSFKVA